MASNNTNTNNNGSVGKWEVVKKGGKKNGNPGKPGDKKSGGARKALAESNLLSRPPLKMSETVYENFEKIAKKQNKEQVPPPTTESTNKKPATGKPSKKASPVNSPRPSAYTHKNLEEAFKALDVSELKQQLGRSQTLFPESPSVWVKDLAGYLNHKLTVPESEPTLSNYAHDYPYCLAGKELRGVIKGLIGRCSDTLPDFFDHCVSTMLRELDRQTDEPLHGYRVCIQAVLQDKPRIATQNLPEYLELLRSVQNRPAKCLTIMWALGQAGFYDLSQGLRVWLGIMLPVLGVKSLSSYALTYLQRLLMLHANLTKGFGIMGPKEFFPLLDFAFMPKNALSSSLQEQLQRLYPRLKVLAFGAKPESTLHTYLPSFLSRATPHCPDDMKRELQKNLQETIQSFRVTNEEMRDTIESQELLECNTLCQNLQVKMRSDSRTARYLHSSGVAGVSQQAWGKVTLYTKQGFSWLEMNTPHYYSESVRVLGPLMDQAMEKAHATAALVAHNTNRLILWVRESTPLLIEWVNTNTPDSVFQVLAYLKELLLILHHDYILPAMAYTSQLLQRAWESLQDSCNGEVSVSCLQGHAVSFTNSTWLLLQHTTSAIKTWAQQLLTPA
ncbi:hypothetical protein CRUP_012913 [Coryphaenoides rupestris]|nr:hypothetical protein CRUP_012913 [Coryphaenoides rupestris]